MTDLKSMTVKELRSCIIFEDVPHERVCAFDEIVLRLAAAQEKNKEHDAEVAAKALLHAHETLGGTSAIIKKPDLYALAVEYRAKAGRKE